MTIRAFAVGEKLPQTLSRDELAAYIGVSLRRFDELRQARTHPAIKELDTAGGRPRFSGAVAQAWGEGRFLNALDRQWRTTQITRK